MDVSKQQETNTSGPNLKPTVVLEPYNIIVPVPWYKRILGWATSNEMKWRLSFITLFIIGSVVALKIQNTQTVQTKAVVNQARIYLLPAKQQLPPPSFVQLWISTDASITNAEIKLSFDPTLLKILQEAVPETSKRFGIIALTPLNTVNKSGDMRITLTTDSHSSPATGSFQLATFMVTANAFRPNLSTTMEIATNSTSLFHNNEQFNILSADGSSISINPTR